MMAFPQFLSEGWYLTIAVCSQAHCGPTSGFLLLCLQIAIEPPILYLYFTIKHKGKVYGTLPLSC